MRSFLLFIAAVFAALPALAAGENPALGFPEIRSWIKDGSEQSYTLRTHSYLESAPADKKVEEYEVYASATAGVRYLNSAASCAFQGPEGQFRVDLTARRISYRRFDEAAKRRLAGTDYGGAGIAELDSFLFSGARLRSRTVKGSVIRYELSYDSASMFRELRVEYDKSQRRLVRLSYSLRRSMAPGAGPDGTIIQQVEMLDYKNVRPQTVSELLNAGSGMLAWLKTTYPGFTITTL